jgi:hypothetical protein
MSPRKPTPKQLLSTQIGPEAADVLLEKIDKMVAEGVSTSKIEKAAYDEISSYMENQIFDTLKVKIGPLEPIKIKPIQVGIKPTVKPTVTSGVRINTGISTKISPIKVGPGTYTKGIK